MESKDEKLGATEEAIVGYMPDPIFNSQFISPAEGNDQSSEQKEKDKFDNEIFSRLKVRIEMAQRKPDEPETITIDDSDDDNPCPVWKPGQYLKKIRQKELNLRMRQIVRSHAINRDVKMLKNRIRSDPSPGNVNCRIMRLPNGRVIRIRMRPKQ